MALLTLDFRKQSTPANDMASSQTLVSTLNFKQLEFCASSLLLQTLGPWFLTFIRKENFGPISKSPFLFSHFSSLAKVRHLWCCQWFGRGSIGGKQQLLLNSLIHQCTVTFDALTPASVHSCWRSPSTLRTSGVFNNHLLCLTLYVGGVNNCLLDNFQSAVYHIIVYPAKPN